MEHKIQLASRTGNADTEDFSPMSAFFRYEIFLTEGKEIALQKVFRFPCKIQRKVGDISILTVATL